ncbi:MAG TPA: carbon monoxide dehydrogenase subunit G [Dongiaceae bacterium]|jgi:hypothetical protein|nr:carbon monoxide dehydrogenase subunit G [Dongiaceae bacterium]
MDEQGHVDFPFPRRLIWNALRDPSILRSAIPYCTEISQTEEVVFDARLLVKLGPVDAPFTVRITLSDERPPRHYRLAANGQGGVAGYAHGHAIIELDDRPDGGTRLRYRAEGEFGGRLAQVGATLLASTARRLAEEFFAQVTNQLAARAASRMGEPATPPPLPPLSSVSVPEERQVRRGREIFLPQWLWMAGLVLAVLLMLLLWVR